MSGRPKPARPKREKLQAVVRASVARTARAEDFEDEDDYESEPNMRLSHAFMVVLVLHLVALGAIFTFSSIKDSKTTANKTQEVSDREAARTAEQSTPTVMTPTKPVVAAVKSAPAVEKKTGVTVQTSPKSMSKSNESVHEVVSGETLAKIATSHGVSVEALQKENGLSTYSTVKAGQKLKIPAASKAAESKKTTSTMASNSTSAQQAATAALFLKTKTENKASEKTSNAPAAASPPAQSSDSTGTTYEVAKGDNPYGIAKKFKVSYAKLLKINNIEDPTKLQIGQKLIIPKK